MSLAAFPIQTSDMPRRPLRKQHSQAHGNAVLGEKSPEQQRVGSMVSFPSHPYRPSEWATNFENNPYRPSEWASNFENTLADPLNGRLILKTSLADPLNGHQILKATLTDPLNGRLILKATLADPLNGHLFRKTPLQTTRKQVFHEKQRKPFRPFGSASSPHGMQQKAGCRERVPQQPAFT